jgi:protein phosphatase
VKLHWAAVTDVGRVRPHNEDHVLAEEPLFAVADGMGGHAAGEVASQVAIEALRTSFAADPTLDGLVRAVQQANAAVWERAHEEDELRGMGTTMTAAALVNDGGEPIVEVANVGDSRGYLLRDGELEQLTEDHSLVEDLVRSGRLAPEDAATHPQKHILTRVLGMEDREGEPANIEVDTFTVIPYRGDRVLLASDGLTNELTDDQIATVLRRFADPDDAARELIRQAKASGGNDNISVVLIDVVDDGDKAGAASAALADEPAAVTTDKRLDDGGAPTGPVAASPAASKRGARPPRQRQRLTIRTVGFFASVLIVLGLAVAAITWYAKGSYFVGLSNNRVTIFRGRPGGFLWVKPAVYSRTQLTADQVPPARLASLKDGQPEANLRAARHYISNLKDESARLIPTTTTTPETTTTVAPPPAP